MFAHIVNESDFPDVHIFLTPIAFISTVPPFGCRFRRKYQFTPTVKYIEFIAAHTGDYGPENIVDAIVIRSKSIGNPVFKAGIHFNGNLECI
jgi:hypothetical protein